MLSELLSIREKPKKLFSELYKIWREEYNQTSKSLPALIIKMNREGSIDFCQLAVQAINEGVRYCLKIQS